MAYLEIDKEVLVHCNIVENNYQYDSRVWYTFLPNKIFHYNSKALEIEGKINITLVIN